MDFKITHPLKIVSFSHIDINTMDLLIYYFSFKNGEIKLNSIDRYSKNGKSGNTYKKEEIFHFEYKKKIFNHKTCEFEEPEIPVVILEDASIFLKGYLVNKI